MVINHFRSLPADNPILIIFTIPRAFRSGITVYFYTISSRLSSKGFPAYRKCRKSIALTRGLYIRLYRRCIYKIYPIRYYINLIGPPLFLP